jgi:hypothetical protein
MITFDPIKLRKKENKTPPTFVTRNERHPPRNAGPPVPLKRQNEALLSPKIEWPPMSTKPGSQN